MYSGHRFRQVGYAPRKSTPIALTNLVCSPELVARLGRDYTIYAYDYSEYETPLVGQGMLSWVLAAASTTPNAPAHQSKTIVTGRVCKSGFPLFSKGSQEMLEVRLRLVPVPTSLQSEYLNSMQQYRQSGQIDLDAQRWAQLMQSNPAVSAPASEYAPSPVDRTGIEHMQQLLTECSTPRDLTNVSQVDETFLGGSPRPLVQTAPNSRTGSPAVSVMRPASEQQKRTSTEAFRPSSRGSNFNTVLQSHPAASLSKQGSFNSIHQNLDEPSEGHRPKRAKLMKADWSDRQYMNLDKQPESLRVAASTAASVRIHRPTPVNPSVSSRISKNDPNRPPTPIPRGPVNTTKPRPTQSRLRRDSSVYIPTSPGSAAEDRHAFTDASPMSPDDGRYNSFLDQPFHMPSSPPVMEGICPQTSSPWLPSLPDNDSGFLSGAAVEPFDEENCGTQEKEAVDLFEDSKNDRRDHGGVQIFSREERDECRQGTNDVFDEENSGKRHDQGAVQLLLDENHNGRELDGGKALGFENSALHEQDMTHVQPIQSDPLQPPKRKRGRPRIPSILPAIPPQYLPLVPQLPPARPDSCPDSHSASRRPSNSGNSRPRPRKKREPLTSPTIPASDPVIPPQGFQPQLTPQIAEPMSDFPACTPAPMSEETKLKVKAGEKRTRQVKSRLDQCIKEGSVPPYCENCGAIETPTWRRAHLKAITGNEEDAEALKNDPNTLFCQPVERDQNGALTSFRQFKKSLTEMDEGFETLQLCNPCGLFLHKCKTMRPANLWQDKNKRPKPRRKRARWIPPPPPPGVGPMTRTRTGAKPIAVTESSPGSSPAEDDATPTANDDNDMHNDDNLPPVSSSGRPQSCDQPPKVLDKKSGESLNEDTTGGLHRGLGSSPGRLQLSIEDNMVSTGENDTHAHNNDDLPPVSSSGRRANSVEPSKVTDERTGLPDKDTLNNRTTWSSPSHKAISPVSDNATATAEQNNDTHNNADRPSILSPGRRASSDEPLGMMEPKGMLTENDAIEALYRAIQFSPAGNKKSPARRAVSMESQSPKRVCRRLFADKEGEPMRPLGDSVLNSPKRNAPSAHRPSKLMSLSDKENNTSTMDGWDSLFGAGEMGFLDFEVPSTPSPRRSGPRSTPNRRNSSTSSRVADCTQHLEATHDSVPMSADFPMTDEMLTLLHLDTDADAILNTDIYQFDMPWKTPRKNTSAHGEPFPWPAPSNPEHDHLHTDLFSDQVDQQGLDALLFDRNPEQASGDKEHVGAIPNLEFDSATFDDELSCRAAGRVNVEAKDKNVRSGNGLGGLDDAVLSAIIGEVSRTTRTSGPAAAKKGPCD